MPSAYLWPHVAAIIEEPWLPTIIYPATGIAGLWQAPAAPPGALGRLLGRTRALVLTALDQPLSTTALAAMTELSPAGVSRHLLALRDAGLVPPPGMATRSATAGPGADRGLVSGSRAGPEALKSVPASVIPPVPGRVGPSLPVPGLRRAFLTVGGDLWLNGENR